MKNTRREVISRFCDQQAGWFLSGPAIILLLLFVVYPFGLAVYSSFTNQSLKTLLQPALLHSVGTGHYRDLLTSQNFWRALGNTGYFVLLVVPVQMGLALLFAVLVNGSAIWQRILRISFFLPVITSMAVLSVVWSLLYNPTSGIFNAGLSCLGIGAQPFLNSPDQAMHCIVAMSVWQGVGFQMMIFLAGLQTIPESLYEAARIENAGHWQQFRYITLPLLKNTVIFVVFITTIFAFKLFVQPHLLTQGGPEGATQTVILQLYETAFTDNQYGKASAICVIFFCLVVVVALLQRRLLPREDKA